MKAFLSSVYALLLTHRVFVSGLLAALALVLQQSLSSGETDYRAIGFAALIAAVGFVANQWKGKGLSVFGIVGTVANAFVTLWQTGTFTWNEFILSALLAVLLAVAGSLRPEVHVPPAPTGRSQLEDPTVEPYQ